MRPLLSTYNGSQLRIRFINESENMHASVEKILASYDDRAPLAEASTIPASWYVDPRIAELERLHVFGKTWQLVARTDQLQKAGEFISTAVAGEPVVVVRGNDGELRAFYNVCRHHAAAVVTQPCADAPSRASFTWSAGFRRSLTTARWSWCGAARDRASGCGCCRLARWTKRGRW